MLATFFLSLVAFLLPLGESVRVQETFSPCVPTSMASLGGETTRQLVRGGEASCCQFSSGIISCASTDNEDGVVIDLDRLPGVSDPNLPAGDAAPRLASGLVAKSGFGAKLTPEKPFVRVVGDKANGLGEGVMILLTLVTRQASSGPVRWVTSTVYGRKLERRIAALVSGTHNFVFSDDQCQAVCGLTKDATRMCATLQLCAAHRPGDAPGEFAVAARGGPDGGTLYWVSVITADNPTAGLAVSTDLEDSFELLSGIFTLQANPKLGRFTVFVDNPLAAVNTLQFTPRKMVFA
jgi:hypothetical protein